MGKLFLGTGRSAMPELVAPGALMSIFAIFVWARAVVSIEKDAVIHPVPFRGWIGPVKQRLIEIPRWLSWVAVLAEEWYWLVEAWAVIGVIPPVYMACGTPGRGLSLGCKSEGINLGVNL